MVAFGFLAHTVAENMTQGIKLLKSKVETGFINSMKKGLFGGPKAPLIVP